MILSDFGNLFEVYNGEGTISYGDNKHVSCQFEAGQLETGEVLIQCNYASDPLEADDLWNADDSSFIFQGITVDHFYVESQRFLMWTHRNSHYKLGEQSAEHIIFFQAGGMSLNSKEGTGIPSYVRFGITNHILASTRKEFSRNHISTLCGKE